MISSGDPVAHAIGLLRPQTTIGPSVEASGSWAVRFDATPHVKIGLVVVGSCWMTIAGHEPVRLEEGDFYLMGGTPGYVLASVPGVDAGAATPADGAAVDALVRIGVEEDEAGETYVCDGQITLDHANASLLTDVLPPLIRVPPGDEGGAQLALLSQLLVAEYDGDAAGRALALNHLGQLLLVHMLRAHARQAGRPLGWLGALNDDGLGDALRAMHGDLAHPWTLSELAGIAHLSRSAFAQAFKAQIGIPPMEYLVRWRMSLASDALRGGTAPISAIARETGYGSESAFTTAFRRVVGTTPARFRHAAAA